MIPFVDFHTHQKSFDKDVFAIQNMIVNDDILFEKYFSIGIHPMYIPAQDIDSQYFTLEKNLQKKECLALGEAGLDKRSEISIDEQIKIFSQQINIAESFEKPVVIHCVKAFSEIIMLKKKLKPSVPMIVHGFNNNENIFNSLLKNDFYFSFGKSVLTQSNALQVLKNTPLDRFFLETDDTNISIKKIYGVVAEILEIDEDVLKNQILENCKNINLFF